MKRIMIGLAVCVAAAVIGVLSYRHFVTRQITDKGGMENPFLAAFPQDAALQGLDWTQTAMNGDDCFTFSLRQEDGRYVASCDFAEEGDRLIRENAPLSPEDWGSVERCLKDNLHTPRQEDGDDDVIVSDETVSQLAVTWETPEGGIERAEYTGSGEDELRSLLQSVLAQISAEYAPRESE